MDKNIKHFQRFDMHVHGPISFHNYSLNIQEYKYKNLLQLFFDSCEQKGIGLCGIISNNDEIKKESIHDRFGYLISKFANKLPKEYKNSRIGKNTFHIKKNNFEVIFINGQSVIVNENGKIFDHLVIGSNDIPNFNTLNEVFKNENFLHISEHPFNKTHRGIGEKLLIEYLERYDAIEHNSQQILPGIFNNIPYLKNYTRSINDKAKEFARMHNKPFVASSDAHVIKHIGTSYIIFDSTPNIKNEETLLRDIKYKIRKFSFTTNERYIPFFEGVEWITKGKIGELFDLYK